MSVKDEVIQAIHGKTANELPPGMSHHTNFRIPGTIDRICGELVQEVKPQIEQLLKERNAVVADLRATSKRISEDRMKISELSRQLEIMKADVARQLVDLGKPSKSQQKVRAAQGELDDLVIWMKTLEHREQELTVQADRLESELYVVTASAISNQRGEYSIRLNRLLKEASELDASFRMAADKAIETIRGANSRPTRAGTQPFDMRLFTLNHWTFRRAGNTGVGG